MATASENNEEIYKCTVERMKDPELWIIIQVPRYVRTTNIEVADSILEATKEGENYLLKPEDILGTQ